MARKAQFRYRGDMTEADNKDPNVNTGETRQTGIESPKSLDALRALVREADVEGGDISADDVFDEADEVVDNLDTPEGK